MNALIRFVGITFMAGGGVGAVSELWPISHGAAYGLALFMLGSFVFALSFRRRPSQ